MKEQYYQLYAPSEEEPTLVYGYKCADMKGVFCFGFNIADGGGLVPLSDLVEGTRIVPVEICEI